MQMSLLKLPDNQEPLSSSRTDTFRAIASSPLSALIKKQSTTPNVQNYKSTNRKNITPKRNLAISITGATSPSGLSYKTTKKNFDQLTPSTDGTLRSKRPSVSSTRLSEASAKAGTTTSLSKLSMKILQQTPQSLTSLQSENTMATAQNTNTKTCLKSLNDFESQSHRGDNRFDKDGNSFLTSGQDGTGDPLGTRRGSFSSINQGINLEKAIETCVSQRSNVTAHRVECKENVADFVQSQVRKALKKSTRTFDRANRIKTSGSLERAWTAQNTVVGVAKEEEREVKEDQESEGQKPLEKKSLILNEENLRAAIITRKRERVKDRKIVQSSMNGLCIKTFSETVSPQQSVIQQLRQGTEELPSTTMNTITTTRENVPQEEELTRKTEYEKLGRKGMMMKRLHERNSRGQSEIFTEEEGQKTRRPILSRVKSEFQGFPKSLNFGESNLLLRESVDNTPVSGVLGEKLSVNQILGSDREVRRGTSQTERSRKKRMEDWAKLKRREDSSEGNEAWKSCGKTVEEILRRNIWEDVGENKTENTEFHIFKQDGHKFFEFNLENKFLQKYNMNRETNLNAEKVETRTNRPTLQDDVQSTKQTRGNLATEGPMKGSKSEKCLKTDPSTMIVRYYDELNPLVIQPKFMENTGSMCVTELWGNKSKQDFYKTMRKPFQSNTILSLSPSSGIYRPEKSIDSETRRHRRIKKEMAENRENEMSAASLTTRSGESRTFMKTSNRFRHTRAFVLQGGSDSNSMHKKSARSFYTRDLL